MGVERRVNFPGVTGNNDLIKKLNLERVIDTVLSHGPISRSQIAALTGLNKVTISNCVDYFLEREILREVGTSETTSRGRPPILLEANGKAAVCIGIEVDYDEVKVLVTDLAGKELERRSLGPADDDPNDFVRRMARLIAGMKPRYSEFRHGVLGVGFALPGYYRSQTGTVEYIAALKRWNGFPIRPALESEHPSVPTFITTTLQAGALAEVHLAGGKTPHVFAYVGGLWGLGVGVCINGQIFSGSSGFAGRLGHSTIKHDGPKCRCGNRGCWELYASARALKERLYPGDQAVDVYQIVDRLRQNDPSVVAAVKEVGHYQGIGLATVINAYNPDAICIGGYLGLMGEPLIAAIRETLAELLPKEVRPHPFTDDGAIYCSQLGDLGACHGAIWLVKSNLTEISFRTLDSAG